MEKKLFIGLIAASMAFSACSLDKSPLDGPTSNSFPSTASEAENGIFAAYKSLASLQGNNTPWFEMMDNITDIGVARRNTAKYKELISSAATGENGCAVALYNKCYDTIAEINLTLDGLEKLEGNTAKEKIEALRSEMYCLRAFCYHLLMMHYGDVPYIDHTLSLSDNQYPRTSKKEILAKLLEQLDDSRLAFLPERFNKENYGTARIGRVTAYGLRARIALSWGNYEIAADAARKCIELAEKNGYKLQPMDITNCGVNHETGEPIGQTALFGYSGQSSDEWLWCVQYNRSISGNTHNASYYHVARTLGGCTYWGPTQAFIDMIQCTDGKSILESPLYDWKQPFKNRDPRLDLYCLRPGARIFDLEYQTSNNAKMIFNYATGKSISNIESQGTKGVYGANGNKGVAGYLWRKYLDHEELNRGAIANGGVSDLNEPLMRLSEIYLIEAEANIEMASGNLELARKDINIIRNRVNMPDVEETTQNGLRKALRYERCVELCDEGFRWFDLRRWGLAEKHLNGKIYAPAQNGDMSNAKPNIDDNWHVTYDESSTWDGSKFNLRVFDTMIFKTNKDELWPLPQTELDTNKEIKENNPGY